ncbi:unnamed protein product [Clonostachys rhizophaga]|uniref:Uncharacterized protein n=1 Tax=Clonostachys rhizophaga TaxID=160324 RepID=A0A9N9YKI0_9HYPO|nr:unnamed protein product [Clonostachys rhizophaga]
MAPLVWMVTGSTSGIGAALVNQIIARGDKVIASGRKTEERLGHLKSDNVALLDLDITSEWPEIKAKMEKAWETFGHIDVLVNNAGTSSLKSAEDADETFINQMFQVNVFGHMKVTRAILPFLRAQGHGRIGFTSSSSEWGPIPFMSHYAASKAALSTYVESLHKEVRPLGIECVSFACGGFPTNLGQPRDSGTAGFGSEGTSIQAYQPLMADIAGMMMEDPMAFMPGDLVKLSTVLVNILSKEGLEAKLPWSVNIALGSDAFLMGKKRVEEHKIQLDRWKDVSCSTDRLPGTYTIKERYSGLISLLEE